MKKLLPLIILALFLCSASALGQSQKFGTSKFHKQNSFLTPLQLKQKANKTLSQNVIADLFFDFEDGFPSNAYYRTGDFGIAEGDTVNIINNFERVQETGTTYLDSYSLKSGEINDDEATNQVLVVKIAQGGGNLQFRYKTSTEEGYDYLRIFVDGEQIAQFSGEQDWTLSSEYSLPEGEHIIDILYNKDGSVSEGSDVVFVDNISVTNADDTPARITKIDPKSSAKNEPLELYGTGFSRFYDLNRFYYVDTNSGTYGYVNGDNKLTSYVPSQIDSGNYEVYISTPYGNATYSELISVLAPSEINFTEESTYTLGTNEPSSIDVEDLNNDGILDLVIGNTGGSPLISWHEGNGDGTFGPSNTISTTVPEARTLLTADIDNDLDLDIIVGSYSQSRVYSIENLGEGNFGTPTLVSTTTSGVLQMDAGDFNNDGFIDITIAEFGSNTVSVLRNNGNDGFLSETTLSGSVNGVTSVEATDIDDDGDLDILSTSVNDSELSWFENLGNGSFNSQQIISTIAQGITSAQAYDMNNDGLKDIITVSENDETVRVFENTGSGYSPITLFSSTGITRKVNVSDINGDGYLDILYSSNSHDRVSYMLNEGTGGFNFSSPVELPETISDAFSFLTSDLNSDGALDIISAEAAGNEITIHMSDGEFEDSGSSSDTQPVITSFSSNSAAPQSTIIISGVNFSETTTGNTVSFDNTEANVLETSTSKLRVQVPTEVTGQVSISVETSEGTYTSPVPFYILNDNEATFEEPQTATGYTGEGNIATADIDGDGNEDLIVPRPNSNQINMLFSDGESPYSRTLFFNYSSTITPLTIKPFSLLGEGYPDFAFISNRSNEFRVLRNTGNTPTSTSFVTQHTISVNHTQPSDIAIADMNQDGINDVIIASEGDNKISWYPNESTQSEVLFGFENAITSFAGDVSSIAAADFNNDGLTDIVAALPGTDFITMYRNSSSGSFTTINLTSSGSIVDPTKVIATDIDQDGDFDIIYATSGSIFGLENNGSGSFSNINIASVNGASDVVAGDINGDGVLDIVASSRNDGSYSWFEHTGNFNFSSGSDLPGVYSGTNALAVLDLDENGQLDVATRAANGGTLSVSRNIYQPIRGGDGLQVQNFNAANDIIAADEELEISFNLNLSNYSNAETWFQGAIEVVNNSGQEFSPSNIRISGTSLFIENNNLFSVDTLSLTLLANNINRNSDGALYLDSNENGFLDTGEENYNTTEFYTTLVGDFNGDFDVDFNDLNEFSNGWRNNNFAVETGPLSFEAGNEFPKAILNPDNNFNIDDLVSFIRFWNYSQEQNLSKRSSKSQSATSSAQKNTSTTSVAESFDFIEMKKDQAPRTYQTQPNDNKEVTYTFSLSHPDSVMGLSLIIDYDETALDITNIEDHELFNIQSENANVLLSHVDSTNGVLELNVANFGSLSNIQDRAIVSLTFASKTDQNSELTIYSDIRAKNRPALQQVAQKAVAVEADLPETFNLSQNYPNPFNPTTTIHYELAEHSRVNLTVYDILGRKVETLLNENGIRPGYYKVAWDASRYASGMYIYVLNVQTAQGQHHLISKKMILVK